MKNVMITGGSGFVGRHLINELFNKYPGITITSLSRSECVISQLLTECASDRLKIALADIRDSEALKYIMRGMDTVIHLAAMKRVDLAEVECREAITINVIGTMNLLDAFQGEIFIQMSTDKAVEPCNCYGATKLAAEKMVLEKSRKQNNGSRYMIIRPGNIVGSTGSVMDIWKRQIAERNEITVTNPDMMRFYISVENVVKLYLAVLERGENGKIYVSPTGVPVLLKDMIEKAIRMYGNKSTKVRNIGIRPGERMEEKMYADYEQNVIPGFEERVEVKSVVPA